MDPRAGALGTSSGLLSRQLRGNDFDFMAAPAECLDDFRSPERPNERVGWIVVRDQQHLHDAGDVKGFAW
jgi:hypothetical protein